MADRFVTVPDSLELPAAVLVPIARLSDAGTAGRAVLDAETAADGRTALGLGGAAVLNVGTGAGDVKAGNYQPTAANISDSTAAGRALLTAADAATQKAALGIVIPAGATGPAQSAPGAMCAVDLAETYLELTNLRQIQIDTYTDGYRQIETATAAGIVTVSGDATVTVTSAIVTGSPLAVSVPLLLGDGPTEIGTKIRAALAATAAVTAAFTVSGTGASIILTAVNAAPNDTTANVAIAAGTATGVTAAPTSTNTEQGSLNEIVHPAVLFFENGWNGYKWWMAYTPYDRSESKWENPSLAVSNDNVTWVTPPGVTNPIEPEPTSGFNADASLFMSADGATMHMVWKYATGTKTTYLRSSTDGVTWTPKLALFTNGYEDVSPAVVYDNGVYKMWTIQPNDTPNNIYVRTAPAPEGPWSAPVLCSYTLPAGVEPWHLDVKMYGSEFFAIICDATYDQSFFGRSADGLTWTFSARLNSGTYAAYRSALVPLTSSRGVGWGVYYGRPGPWRVMYTEITFDKSRRERDVLQDILLSKLQVKPWILCDTFDRADASTELGVADSGQTWVAASGGAVGIVSGMAYSPVSAGLATIDLGVSNFYLEFALGSVATGANGSIHFRRLNSTNYWRLTHVGPSPSLSKTVASATTYYALSSVMPPLVAGDRLGIYCNGSTVSIYRNRTLAYSRTDSDLSTATIVGVAPDTRTERYDNIIAKSL